MSSNWIRTVAKYALLCAPAVVLVALIGLIGVGSVVARVLNEPARFTDASFTIQKLSKAAYWHTRRHWHTIPECVVFDRELLYRPRPGACIFENAEFRTTMHFDSGGARLTPSATIDHAQPRLVIVGDSHAMGWGVEDHETFASVLASDFGFQTVNLAVSSYATPRELLRLRRDHPLAAGDILVIQYCDNDYAENREFARHGSGRSYEHSELQSLLDYPPAASKALPVAGIILRTAWSTMTRNSRAETADPDPTDAFLAVASAYPELSDYQTVVVAINGPKLGTHLDVARLAAAGLTLIVPDLDHEDFMDLDDHMRPRGHRKVAETIAATLRR